MTIQLKALLIEDDDTTRATLAAVLETSGFSCTGVAKGANGITALTHEAFDLVVVDWLLPDISGPDLIETLRATPHGYRPRIIVVTSAEEQRASIEAMFGNGISAGDVFYKRLGVDDLSTRFRVIARDLVEEATASGRMDKLEAQIASQGASLEDHMLSIEACSKEKDMQIETLRKAFADITARLAEIQENTKQTQDIIKAWGQVRWFAGLVTGSGRVIIANKAVFFFVLSFTIAIWGWVSTGVWHFKWMDK